MLPTNASSIQIHKNLLVPHHQNIRVKIPYKHLNSVSKPHKAHKYHSQFHHHNTVYKDGNLPDGQSLVCLGDEPYNTCNQMYVEGADWLLCEAFCLYEDRERFKPYEKHHSTALDAGRLAAQLGVKNLLLYHTEDKTLATRKERYAAEAASQFSGKVYVPDDLEEILLQGND